MGYLQPLKGDDSQRQLKLMMVGQITALEPDFPNGGAPTLRVRGLNVLHRFRKQQHTWTWENKRDSDIARELGQRAVSPNRPGLGIKVQIDNNAAMDEAEEPIVFMHNQYDIIFLIERAMRHGYTVYLM